MISICQPTVFGARLPLLGPASCSAHGSDVSRGLGFGRKSPSLISSSIGKIRATLRSACARRPCLRDGVGLRRPVGDVYLARANLPCTEAVIRPALNSHRGADKMQEKERKALASACAESAISSRAFQIQLLVVQPVLSSSTRTVLDRCLTSTVWSTVLQ